MQTSDNAFLFSGEQWDPNGGFYYLRARYMNPSDGRFTQHDSFDGFAQDPRSLHKYVYANNYPTNATDPSGHYTLGEAVSSMNTVANLANHAMNILSIVYPDLAEQIDSELPGVLDFLLPPLIKAVGTAYASGGGGDGCVRNSSGLRRRWH